MRDISRLECGLRVPQPLVLRASLRYQVNKAEIKPSHHSLSAQQKEQNRTDYDSNGVGWSESSKPSERPLVSGDDPEDYSYNDKRQPYNRTTFQSGSLLQKRESCVRRMQAGLDRHQLGKGKEEERLIA